MRTIRKRWLILLGIAIVAAALLGSRYTHSKANSTVYRAVADNIGILEIGSEVNLQNVVPFEWDEAYIFFDDIGDKKEIKKLYGISKENQKPNTILFLLQGEVVMSLPMEGKAKIPYEIDCSALKDSPEAQLSVLEIHPGDALNFVCVSNYESGTPTLQAEPMLGD